MIELVISGGQSGADLAGLQAASEANIPTGGTACKGWKIRPPGEKRDVAAPWLADYGLVECDRAGYPARTRANVRDADFTLVFIDGPIGPGTALTIDLLCRSGKAYRVITRGGTATDTPAATAEVLRACEVKVLNCAGSRETLPPRVGKWVKRYLTETFRILKGEAAL
jgi:hypothetical protein